MNYDAWYDAYDYIFPLKAETLAFLIQTLQKGRVCDLGCGSGSYAIALAEKGFKVDAFDLSENLIQLGSKKAKTGLPLRFQTMNMCDFSAVDKYDGLYVIGNTLVHLSQPDVKSVIEKIGKALKKDGHGVIQIVNYDRVIRKNITELPKIENPPYSMERHYEIKPKAVAFTTILRYKDNIQKNTIDLYPLKYTDLLSFLKAAGFIDINCYGAFDFTPFDIDTSQSLIVTFKR